MLCDSINATDFTVSYICFHVPQNRLMLKVQYLYIFHLVCVGAAATLTSESVFHWDKHLCWYSNPVKPQWAQWCVFTQTPLPHKPVSLKSSSTHCLTSPLHKLQTWFPKETKWWQNEKHKDETHYLLHVGNTMNLQATLTQENVRWRGLDPVPASNSWCMQNREIEDNERLMRKSLPMNIWGGEVCLIHDHPVKGFLYIPLPYSPIQRCLLDFQADGIFIALLSNEPLSQIILHRLIFGFYSETRYIRTRKKTVLRLEKDDKWSFLVVFWGLSS